MLCGNGIGTELFHLRATFAEQVDAWNTPKTEIAFPHVPLILAG